MKKYDYLIVGAGFSGAVLAERLKSIHKEILIVEKRDHIGGNSYDYYNKSGILVHKYGPHYFRTNNDNVFNYLSKFTKWRPYEYRIRSYVDGRLYPFPINIETLNMFFNVNLNDEYDCKEFLESKKINIKNPKNAEEQVLSTIGAELYETFFKNYTIKQWNTDPKNLDASITARIPLRYNRDDRYFEDKIQVIPLDGYFNLFENLLKDVDVWLNTDYFDIKNEIYFKNLIYTGPIDRLLDYKFGKLPYRSLIFIHEDYNKSYYQNWVQINYPNDFDYTRIVEIKHATGQKSKNTTIVKEYPSNTGEPFYPVVNNINNELYLKYKQDAEKLNNTNLIGRLANYKYLNMDQVVQNALDFFEILKMKN